jgi:hypothetical protein
LEEDVIPIFACPQRFGISADSSGAVLSMDLLESLLITPKWSLLNIDILTETLGHSERYKIVDDRVHPLFPVAAEEFRPEDTPLPDVVFFPARKGGAVPADPTAGEPGPERFYKPFDVALVIAANRSESYEAARVLRLSSGVARQHRIPLVPLGNGVVVAGSIPKGLLEPVAANLIRVTIPALEYRDKFAETLYLDDTYYQTQAARYLFNAKPQGEVEAELVAYLRDEDPDVVFNAISALSVPSYSVPFVPGRPLPPREERLEPVSVSPATLEAILARAADEHDLDILSAINCTLNAQNYLGKLRPLVPRVRKTVRKMIREVQTSEREVKVCKSILSLLPDEDD